MLVLATFTYRIAACIWPRGIHLRINRPVYLIGMMMTTSLLDGFPYLFVTITELWIEGI